jgi:hypothetical protein
MLRSIALVGVSFLGILAAAPLAYAQTRPPEPYLVEGACPFEGCIYREWTAREPLRVYQTAGDTAELAFTLPAGTRFTAETGHVRLKKLGVVIIHRSLHQYGYDGGGRRFEPGDTLYVLDYLGEGFYSVWYNGEILEATDYWYAPDEITAENREMVRAIQLREPEPEWWTRISLPDGRTGWLFMREANVEGADALD